jgi:hypothetical protein
MGTFAKTAIVYYRVSFANQKTNTHFHFCFQLTNGSFPFPAKKMEVDDIR